MIGPWRRFYCLVPYHLKDRVLLEGLRPRTITGSEVIQIYPSRRQVDRYLKKGRDYILIQVDADRLKSKFLTKVDYDHIFYKAPIPPDAVRLLRTPR